MLLSFAIPSVLMLTLFWLLSNRMGSKGIDAVLLFSSCWILGEMLREYFFAFPWNILGNVWLGILPVSQVASLIGAYGLSILAVIVALVPVLLWRNPTNSRISVMIIIAVVVICYGYGQVQLNQGDIVSSNEDNVRVRIVQANLTKEQMYSQLTRFDSFLQHVKLTQKPESIFFRYILFLHYALYDDEFCRILCI